MKKLELAAVLAMLLLLAGCGGPSVTTRRAVGPGAWAPKIGDTAEYETSTAFVLPGAQTPTQVSGSMRSTIVAATNHGRSLPSYIARTFDVRDEITAGTGLRSRSRMVLHWRGVDATGNVYLLGESLDGTTWDVVTDPDPPVYMPAEIKPGISWRYVTHFASGSTESSESTCVCTEELATAAGSFHTLKVSVAYTRTGTGAANVTGCTWLASSVPSVFDVKSEYDGTTPIGGMQVTASLVYNLKSLRLAQ